MSEDLGLVEQILTTQNTTEDDYLIKTLESPVAEDQTPLSEGATTYINDINRDVYGPNASEILTEADLKSADREAMEQIFEEDITNLNQATMQDIQEGNADFNVISDRAAAYVAMKEREEGYIRTPYGLQIMAGREYADEAVINNIDQNNTQWTGTDTPVEDDFFKGLNKVGSNLLMIQQEIADRIEEAHWYDLTGNVLFESLPGVGEFNAKDALINPEEGSKLDPGQARVLNNTQWTKLAEELSPEEFAVRWKEYIKTLEDRGFNNDQIALICLEITDPSYYAENISTLGDLFAAGSVVRAASTGFKGAKAVKAIEAIKKARELTHRASRAQKAADALGKAKDSKKALKMAQKASKLKEQAAKTTEQATKLAAEAKIPMTTAEKLADKSTGVAGTTIKEALAQTVPLVGDLLGDAVKGTLNVVTALPRKFLTRASRKGLFEDIQGETQDVAEAVKAGRLVRDNIIKTKFDGAVADALKPVATGTENIAASRVVRSEVDYLRSLDKATTMLARSSHLNLEEAALTAEMLERASTVLSNLEGYKPTNLAEAVRLANKDDVIFDSTGKLVARVRADKPGSRKMTYEQAKQLASDLSFKSDSVIGQETGLSVEAFPMPLYTARGKKKAWKVDAEVSLNKGFGVAFSEASGLKNDKWTSHKVAPDSMFTLSTNPVAIKRLGYLRELQAENIISKGEEAQKSFRQLKKADKGLFRLLAEHSINTGAFLNTDYLIAKGASPEFVKAYTDWRRMNDLDYLLINAYRRDTMVRQGVKALSVGDHYIGYGRVLRTDIKKTLEGTTRKIIFDDFDAKPKALNKVFGDGLTDAQVNERLDTLIEQGYVLIERSYGQEKALKGNRLYYLINGHNIVENDLPEFITNYLAGGRRFFDSRAAFVKQGVWEKDEEGVERFVGVKTVAADLDEVGLTRKTKGIERLRKAVVDRDESLDTFNTIVREEGLSDIPWNNFDDFKAWAKEHEIDIERSHAALEVVKDGDMLSSVNTFLGEAVDELDKDALFNLRHRSAFMALTEEAKMQKWMRQGNDILGWNFKDTMKIADFDRNIQMMVQDMVNMGVMSKWDDFYCDLFYQQFAKLAEDKGVLKDKMTPRQLLYAIWSPDGKAADISPDATAAAKNYWAIKGVPTDLDRAIAQKVSGIFKGIEGAEEIPLRLSHGLNLFGKSVEKLNPLKRLRQFASYMTMAWAPGQFGKQAMPIAYVGLMKPQAVPYVMEHILPVFFRVLSWHGSTPLAMERYYKIFGETEGKMQGLYKFLIKANVMAPTGLGGLVEPVKPNTFNNISFAFKNSGELLNRLVAYMAAYYDSGYAATKGIESERELARVISKAESYFMNMGPTGMARIQTTQIAKTAAQFQSYFWRFIETAMFDKELTTAEKWQLRLGMLALSGEVGVFGAKGYVKTKECLNALSTDDEGYDTMGFQGDAARIFEIGTVNYLLEELGYDINLGDTIAIPVSDFADKGVFGFMFTVPAWSSTNKALNGVIDLYNMLGAQYHAKNYITAAEFEKDIAAIAQARNMPSGIAQQVLALEALRTGEQFNKYGQLTDKGNKDLIALRQLLGLGSITDLDIAIHKAEEQSMEEKEKEYEKDMRALYYANYKTPGDPAIEAMIRIKKAGTDLPREKQFEKDKLLGKQAITGTNISYDEWLLTKELKRKSDATHLILKYNRGEQ